MIDWESGGLVGTLARPRCRNRLNLGFDALNACEQHVVRLLVGVVAACVGCALIGACAYLYGVNGTLGGVVAAEHLIAAAL
jgi:hypothetical protein